MYTVVMLVWQGLMAVAKAVTVIHAIVTLGRLFIVLNVDGHGSCGGIGALMVIRIEALVQHVGMAVAIVMGAIGMRQWWWWWW
jgi:alpha-galactosidase/6-phospho-beta-glucosidase family protein